jgi:predicted alpha/beta-hydrolase family hydrolase
MRPAAVDNVRMAETSFVVPATGVDLPARHYAADRPKATLVFAPGAGAGHDHPWMRARAADLRARGVSVVTFDFPYKARQRRAPDKAPVLVEAFRAVMNAVARRVPGPLLAGGKSMGGRMATMLAAEPPLPERLVGVVALGYPLHPPGKPEQLRVAHLPRMAVPVLVVQGTRDPFGGPDAIAAEWRRAGAEPTVVAIEDGGHGFEVPRRTRDQAETYAKVADSVTNWLDTLLSASGQ